MSNEDTKEKIKEAGEAIAEDLKEALDEGKEFIDEFVETAKEVIDEIDFESKYKEVLAEMENLRKRLDTEKSEILKYRASNFILEILPNLDMFEQALNAKEVSDEIKNWLVGFEMILRNFQESLKNEGIQEIEVKQGDEFDAMIHHAIEEVETDEVEPGKIYQVKQKGYMLHKRLLRPVTVTVAKGATQEGEE